MQAKADPGTATYLVVSSGTSQIAGTPFTVTVTAYAGDGSVATITLVRFISALRILGLVLFCQVITRSYLGILVFTCLLMVLRW